MASLWVVGWVSVSKICMPKYPAWLEVNGLVIYCQCTKHCSSSAGIRMTKKFLLGFASCRKRKI